MAYTYSNNNTKNTAYVVNECPSGLDQETVFQAGKSC